MVQSSPKGEQLPIIALIFTVALSTTFTSLNRQTTTSSEPGAGLRERHVLHAIFCLEVALMYVAYMVISRILALALSCIEHVHPSGAVAAYDSLHETEQLVWDDEEEEAPPAAAPAHQVSILFARGIHREALISSMYLGGSGCFLALPSLSFWNLSLTCMLLVSLCLIALFGEHTKLVEFAPNADKASVLQRLRLLRWALYASTFVLLMGILIKDNEDLYHRGIQEDTGTITGPTMLLLAAASPVLLRLALPPSAHHIKNRPTLMSPSQVLEAALPVSCLHAVLVLGWYSPPLLLEIPDRTLPLFIPMMILCPFCQVVTIAFILRGFRQRQTLPTVIVLALTAFIVQQIFGPRLTGHSDWFLLVVCCLILALSAGLLYVRRSQTASPGALDDLDELEELRSRKSRAVPPTIMEEGPQSPA